jgi:cysteinyl-tRNA synthetase
VERFFAELADDFNTAAARATLFEWIAEGNRRIDAGEALGRGRLDEMLHALGLEDLLEEPAEETPDAVRRLADQREEARAQRDFDRADRIREELAERGWEVRDTTDGAQLVRKE